MPGKHYTKKGKGFRMNGMDFGAGTGSVNPMIQRAMDARASMGMDQSVPLTKKDSPDDYDEFSTSKMNYIPEVKLVDKKDTNLSKLTQKAEWDKEPNEAGYITKSKTGINLFGRKRDVTKYYDPETGKKLGKQVTVARGKGDPRPDKVKIKRVNRGLTQEGGVGKIRLDKNPWETGAAEETDINRAQRGAEVNDKNVTYDAEGNPILPGYAKAYKSFPEKGGKKINPRTGAEYTSIKDFADDAEEWWDEQANITQNEKLRKQDQPYGLDEEGNVKYSKPLKYGRTNAVLKRKKYTMKKKK